MPTAVEPEVSFDVRMQLRENMLAWISRDVGLTEFLIPDEFASAWTQEQKEAWTTSVVNKFMHLSLGKSSVATRKRILACETAGVLRRCCLQLRERAVSHRDVMKTSVALEALWDRVSGMLEDSTWATCSLMFDTALISLRVAYVWIYLKAEASEPHADLETRKTVFEESVKGFFTTTCPTDDATERHSDNYKKLLDAWRQELDEYHKQDKFESLITRLEKSQSLEKTAACVEKFIATVNIDNSWVLNMQTIGTEIESGLWNRKGKGRGGRKAASKPKRLGAAKGDYDEPPSPLSESFEPAASDSDFDIENAAEEEDVDDQDEDYSGSGAEEEDEDEDEDEVPAIRLGSSGMELRSSPRISKGRSRKVAGKRRAALTAEKRIHRDTVYETGAERKDRRREALVAGGMKSAEDMELELRSPYVERRVGRGEEGRKDGARRRLLRGRGAGMDEAEGRKNGPVEYQQSMMRGEERLQAEERQRLVEAALAGNDLAHSEKMEGSGDVRRSPRRGRK